MNILHLSRIIHNSVEMGSSSSLLKNQIEKCAFPAPKRSGYDVSNKRLFFVGNNETAKIACMRYNENISKPVILYSHGNATDIGYIDSNQYLQQLSRDMNVGIVSYDYPGYGLSPGIPSESECIRAINTIFDHLISIGHDPKNIILFGSSIGTGPTANLASRVTELRGVVLQTPYTTGLELNLRLQNIHHVQQRP